MSVRRRRRGSLTHIGAADWLVGQAALFCTEPAGFADDRNTMSLPASEREKRQKRILQVIQQRSGKEDLTLTRIAELTGIPLGTVTRYVCHLTLEGRVARVHGRAGLVSMAFARREWEKSRRRRQRRRSS